jgi:CRISPR-associated protein Cas2
MEISPGVFIGGPTARIREALWAEVLQYADTGRALLAYTTNNEQGFTFETHDHKWHPIDHDGLTLIRRPKDTPEITSAPSPSGWSNAAKRRRYGQR